MNREIITTLTELELRNLIRDEISLIIPELRELLKEMYIEKDEILSRKEVQELLHISYVTIHKKMKEDLPYMRAGRRVLFSKKELLKWIKDQTKITINRRSRRK